MIHGYIHMNNNAIARQHIMSGVPYTTFNAKKLFLVCPGHFVAVRTGLRAGLRGGRFGACVVCVMKI
jgi:hypothetical protein